MDEAYCLFESVSGLRARWVVLAAIAILPVTVVIGLIADQDTELPLQLTHALIPHQS